MNIKEIFLIENTDNDCNTIDTDRGAFLTREAAQARCDELNQQSVERAQSEYRRDKEVYDYRIAANAAMQAYRLPLLFNRYQLREPVEPTIKPPLYSKYVVWEDAVEIQG